MACYEFEPRAGQGLANLQRHLPTGWLWDAFRVPGKLMYRLLVAFSLAYEDMTAALCHLAVELNPFTTEQLIEEWERACGLPDPCLPKATTLEERRAWVIFRLAKRKWTTAGDWHDLAALFGLTISITPGWYVQRPALYDARYPKRYDRFPKLGRFRVYIDVDGMNFGGYDYGKDGRGDGYPVPYGLSVQGLDGFMCMIDRVRPANVVVIWNQFPTTDERVCTRRTFDDIFAEPFC